MAAPSDVIAAPAPSGASVADRVKAQLQHDYPPGALSWVSQIAWNPNPVRVPLDQIDWNAGDWSASDDGRKVAAFAKRIAAGWRKPLVAVRRPGSRLVYLVDGHTRASACKLLGQPVTAWVGTAKTDHGDWTRTHARQLANEGLAVELTAQTATASTVPHPFGSPSGPGLWRIKGAALDPYIQNVARALLASGRAKDRSGAIRLAYGLMYDWAAGRTGNGKGRVHPDVQAAAARALAHMNGLRAQAHSHANDAGAVELAAPFNPAAHPRVTKGHGNGGQFGSQGTNLKAPPAARDGFKPAATPGQAPAPEPPEPPAEAARIAQLRSQAAQDRQLARQIFAKADALTRIRAGYIAGILTPTGRPKGAAAGKPAVNAKRSAAAKKAAATRKAKTKSSTKGAKAAASAAKAAPVTAAAAKAANVAKLDNQISLLRHDAGALIKSANHLDQLANRL